MRSTAHFFYSYIEAVRVLYSTNTFDLQRTEMITMHLPRLLPACHLECLRSLRLRWEILPDDQPYPGLPTGYISDHPGTLTKAEAAFAAYDAVWAAIAALPGLRELRVALLTMPLCARDLERDLEVSVEELRRAWLGPTARLKDKALAVFELGLGASWVWRLWDMQRYLDSSDYAQVLEAGPRTDEDFVLFAMHDWPHG